MKLAKLHRWCFQDIGWIQDCSITVEIEMNRHGNIVLQDDNRFVFNKKGEIISRTPSKRMIALGREHRMPKLEFL